MVKPKPACEGPTFEEAVDVRFRDNAGLNWFRPARVLGMLNLEHYATFEDLNHAEPPVLYDLSGVKDWADSRWPRNIENKPRL